ncbi:MAG: DUF1080 domain-containing protein [Isosphaeraceae bacterium]
MRPALKPFLHVLVSTTVLSACALSSRSEDAAVPNWIELTGEVGLDAWKAPTPGWEVVGSVALNPEKPRRLVGKAGKGIIYNGVGGFAPNLISRRTFGDIEAHFEFMVPKGSNSGVKFEEVYEIQIDDSYGQTNVTASHCGGVYPRAELLPNYHHIDKGFPPKTNACKPPGEWQTLDVVFRAPRLDASGKKRANARFVKVVLNGQLVQDDLEVPYPTGHNWRNKEHATGALLLQGDHGPVAFRNIRVRPLP